MSRVLGGCGPGGGGAVLPPHPDPSSCWCPVTGRGALWGFTFPPPHYPPLEGRGAHHSSGSPSEMLEAEVLGGSHTSLPRALGCFGHLGGGQLRARPARWVQTTRLNGKAGHRLEMSGQARPGASIPAPHASEGAPRRQAPGPQFRPGAGGCRPRNRPPLALPPRAPGRSRASIRIGSGYAPFPAQAGPCRKEEGAEGGGEG